MKVKIFCFSIHFLPFVPMDHFPALVSSGHCPAWQWKSSELCTTQLPHPTPTQYNSLFFHKIFSTEFPKVNVSLTRTSRDEVSPPYVKIVVPSFAVAWQYLFIYSQKIQNVSKVKLDFKKVSTTIKFHIQGSVPYHRYRTVITMP